MWGHGHSLIKIMLLISDNVAVYYNQMCFSFSEYSQGMILTANNTSNDKLKTTTSPKIDIIKNSPTKVS